MRPMLITIVDIFLILHTLIEGEKDSLSAEGRSIDLPTDEILATSNTYEQVSNRNKLL